MTPEVQAQIAKLKEVLRVRENQPGYKDNVAAIRAKIEQLEAS